MEETYFTTKWVCLEDTLDLLARLFNPAIHLIKQHNYNPPASVTPFLEINTDKLAIKSKSPKLQMLANSPLRCFGEGNCTLAVKTPIICMTTTKYACHR
ncbi:hypothetical protein AV530_008706 [Patagioenas fasciata monilis]|uniref:Uncharacterized protein n=1 Tax=Patagioenas fasciata monilis TaxID=372326 RepID=A0A1V4L1D0_PATFA|nr:hypothetical protein AV530_008706 [Patagioenas fasciata monilis]